MLFFFPQCAYRYIMKQVTTPSADRLPYPFISSLWESSWQRGRSALNNHWLTAVSLPALVSSLFLKQHRYTVTSLTWRRKGSALVQWWSLGLVFPDAFEFCLTQVFPRPRFKGTKEIGRVIMPFSHSRGREEALSNYQRGHHTTQRKINNH